MNKQISLEDIKIMAKIKKISDENIENICKSWIRNKEKNFITKHNALRLMKDINMKFDRDDEFEEKEFLVILNNYIEVKE